MKSARAYNSSSVTGLAPRSLDGFIREQRVVTDDRHPQGSRPLRHRRPDIAHAHDPQRLAGKLNPLQLLLDPQSRFHRCIGARDHARQRQHQPQGVLGHRQGGRLRRVDHNHAASRRRLQVDVIHTHACPSHHLQPWRGRQDLRRHPGAAAHDQRLAARYGLQQLRRGDPGPIVHLRPSAQQRLPALIQAIADQHRPLMHARLIHLALDCT